MSKIEINKLTNANIYMNGTNLLGRAEEVQLPQIKHKMAEHKALGMVGSAEFFAGIDKLECKIKWNALYPNVLRTCANPFLATMIQVRASLETYNGAGRINEVPATAFLIGTFKEFPLMMIIISNSEQKRIITAKLSLIKSSCLHRIIHHIIIHTANAPSLVSFGM